MESAPLPKPFFDDLPLAVLVLVSVCGVLCNGAVLLLFCMRKSLLRTASDLFTINLSFVDFLFSGLVLPVVVITRLKAKSACEDKNQTNLEVARNCIVLFGTVAIALGTLLVSLDRGDVSLKPSKRFFNQYKAIIAIGLTWCISSLGIPIAILPSLLSLDGRKEEDYTINKIVKSSYITTKWSNKTLMKYIDETEERCCNPHPCNEATLNSCTIQIIFEVPIFIAAILAIIIIYGKILWSVQRRSKKYINGSIRPSNSATKSSKLLWFESHCGTRNFNSCCSRQSSSENQGPRGTFTKKNCPKSTSLKAERNVSKNASNQKKTSNIRKAKKQDSLEDALFVQTSEKVDNNQNSPKPPEANAEKASKTDFATVAMSVTVVLAIKRMAARKIKERKKKIQHLRKMTFLIIFTFLFCWTPYYASTLSLALSLHSDNEMKNNVTENLTSYRYLYIKNCTQGNIFTWTLSIAALASIINPALYIFSREKIRLEFIKTFFSSRTSERTSSLKKSFTSCLVCWDTEENIGRSKKRVSVFNTGWHNKVQRTNSEKSNVELEQVSENARKSSNTCSNSREVLQKDTRGDVPILRWDLDGCDTNESHEELYKCTEDVTPNLGLLLAPTQHRPRSLSARSVDIMSCSTTIASLAADL